MDEFTPAGVVPICSDLSTSEDGRHHTVVTSAKNECKTRKCILGRENERRRSELADVKCCKFEWEVMAHYVAPTVLSIVADIEM